MTSSTLSGGIVDFWSGFMKRLRVFHQSFGEKFVDPTAMSTQMREVSDF